MNSALDKMKSKIEETDFNTPKPSIISNVTANAEDNAANIKTLLIKQIVSRVRWRESVNYMMKNGVTNFIEIGPGKVLSGLVKKIDKNVKISNFNNVNDIEK
tara:strand:+ start:215 stop:520 length:306 start_codon:yes stop_codon:yes gene_type:complete